MENNPVVADAFGSMICGNSGFTGGIYPDCRKGRTYDNKWGCDSIQDNWKIRDAVLCEQNDDCRAFNNPIMRWVYEKTGDGFS